GELSTLRATCGPRCVDECGEIVQLAVGTSLFESFVGDVGAALAQFGEFRLVETPDRAQLGGVGADGFHTCGVFFGLHEGGLGARIGEDPLDLFGGGGLEDGDGDGTDGPERVVDDGPLVAG